jgi:S1-C subfamily serine protease
MRQSAQPPQTLIASADFVVEPSASGVRVSGVNDNSPAARLSLKAGDILVRVNGAQISTVEDAQGLLKDWQPDARISVQVKRGGNTVTLSQGGR